MLGYLFCRVAAAHVQPHAEGRQRCGPVGRPGLPPDAGRCLVVAVVAGLEAQAVMDLRYSGGHGAVGPGLAVLMGCFVAVGTTHIFGTLLTAAGDPRLLNTMAAGAWC